MPTRGHPSGQPGLTLVTRIRCCRHVGRVSALSDSSRPPSPLPPTQVRELDPDMPNAARMYDYYLGGAAHSESDRQLADQALSCTHRNHRSMSVSYWHALAAK